MNIWIVNHYAYGPDQSAGTRHYKLARALRSKGHDVLIVASSFYHKQRHETRLSAHESYRRTVLESVVFQWIRTPAYQNSRVKRLWNMWVFAWRVYRRQWQTTGDRPDVIVGSSPSLLAALAGLLVGRRMRIAFVLEIRDLWPDSLQDIGGLSRWNVLYLTFKTIERFLYRNADFIVTVLPSSHAHIVANGGTRKRIAWIPNGVDLNQRPQLPEHDARKPFIVTYFGAHGAYNGLDKVIEAAVVLRDAGWDSTTIRFVLIGDGPDKSALMDLAKTLEVEQYIEFRDAVPTYKLWSSIHDAGAFLMIVRPMATLTAGISPNKLWEYLAAGRPILFSTVGGDQIRDESGAGISVVPGDAQSLASGVARLYFMSPADRKAMGENARRYVADKADIPRLATQYEQVLTQTAQYYSAPRHI